MSFAEDLEYLQHIYLRLPGHAGINPLLSEIGCDLFVSDKHAYRTHRSLQPAAIHDAIVNEAFRGLLHWYCECGMSHVNGFAGLNETTGFSIVTGLLAKSRWRDCIDSPASAYHLAILLTHLADTTERVTPSHTLYFRSLKETVGPVVRQLVDEWAQPDTPLPPFVSVSELTRLLFGDAWCEIMAIDGLTAPKQIYLGRPPFISGIPFFEQSGAVSLPTLEGP